MERPSAAQPDVHQPRPRGRSVAVRVRELGATLARRRWVRTAAVVLAAVAVVVWVASIALDEPMRRTMEAKLNARLKGYHLTIGRFDLHPVRLGWDLDDVTLVQEHKPDPPVAHIDAITATVQWRALLLHAALVADIVVHRPSLHLTLEQSRAEANDETPVEKRGWQDAVTQLHPAKINAFRIYDGDVTYDDQGDLPPITLSRVYLLTENIRNVRSAQGVLPSPVHLDAVLFDHATLRFDGNADLLATPQPALAGDYGLQGMALAPLATVAHHWGIGLDRGVLDADGHVTVGNDGKTELVVRDGVAREPNITLQSDAAGAGEVKQAATTAAKAATRSEPAPATAVRIEQFTVENGRGTLTNAHSDPPWTLFLNDMRVDMQHFSTVPGGEPGMAHVQARFMDSGPVDVRARVTPPTKGPDFQASVAIEHVDLRTLNDLLRASGGFDVNRGTFSFWSEVTVRDGEIRGYAKPYFQDLDVYDAEKDRDKNVLEKAWEATVGGVATILSNRERDSVATETDLSGRVDSPQTSTWQVVVKLVQNAFVRAILPGLTRERTG